MVLESGLVSFASKLPYSDLFGSIYKIFKEIVEENQHLYSFFCSLKRSNVQTLADGGALAQVRNLRPCSSPEALFV